VVEGSKPTKIYKDYKIYSIFALNRLVLDLDIDIYQDNIEEKLDEILASRDSSVTKEDIKHEIRSNHYMTNKVLKKLESDGFVTITKRNNQYTIRITKKGIMHLRKFNEFYMEIYNEQIRDHYKYVRPPSWVKL
jgi:predicted transcriptional regulator